jgi:hypothetical protein
LIDRFDSLVAIWLLFLIGPFGSFRWLRFGYCF